MISYLVSRRLSIASLFLCVSLPALAGNGNNTKPIPNSIPKSPPVNAVEAVDPTGDELNVLHVKDNGNKNEYDYYARCTGISSANDIETCSVDNEGNLQEETNKSKSLCLCAIALTTKLSTEIQQYGLTQLNYKKGAQVKVIRVKTAEISQPGKPARGTRVIIKIPNADLYPSAKPEGGPRFTEMKITRDEKSSWVICYADAPGVVTNCLNKKTAKLNSREFQSSQQSTTRR